MPYSLSLDESVPEGIRRIAVEQLDRAIEELTCKEGSLDMHVHEARKSMKRLRAVVRLVRAQLGDQLFRLENACYRDAASQLGGMRDATVLIDSLDGLVEASGKKVSRNRFATVRKWLVERREAAYQADIEQEQVIRQVVNDLRWSRRRVDDWPLKHGGWKGVERGVERVYGRGRQEFERAYLQGDAEVFHEWRKWAKYLWYHTQLLQPIWPPAMKSLADQLDELGEALGKDHDLTVLRSVVLSELSRPIRASTLQGLLELSDNCRQQLRERAQGIGRRVYVERPRDFVRRMRGYWQAWRKDGLERNPPIAKESEMKAEPELIADYQCQTGEGPLWHPLEQRLYWVDIPAGRLFRYDPATGKHEQCYAGEAIGGLTLQADGALLLFMARGAIARWQAGKLEWLIEEIAAERDSRFNDVIADPAGRVFCGTMSTKDRPGRLYRLDLDGSLTVVLEGIGCSNGMGFTPDRKQLYYTDSGAKKIYLFDYDQQTGELTKQRIFVDSSDQPGVPDGLTVDAEGYVWSARWDGGCLIRYTAAGEEERRIPFPARKVSCAIFGGKQYSQLYVTTAGGDNKPVEGTGAGALFRIDPGVKGTPEFFSRIVMLEEGAG